MREFVLLSHGVTKVFPLNSLPNAGRMDIVCNSIRSALWISFGIRKDVVFHVFLYGEPHPELHIKFVGEKLRKASPDERNLAILIRKAIERFQKKEIQSTPGVFISSESFSEFLGGYRSRNIYVMDEKGMNIQNIKIKENPVFVLGDNLDIPEKYKSLLSDYPKISLGNISYLASECITILNYLLDSKENLNL